MPLNPSGAISLAGPVAGQSIAVELGQSATATISLNDTNVRTLAQVPSGVIVMPTDFWGKGAFTPTQRAIFAFGATGPASANRTNISNLISSTGVVASDTPGVGSVRILPGAATYGGDKAIFGYGIGVPTYISFTNLVSNTGVVASDTPGVGTARGELAAAGYGGDKAIFGYGIGTPARVSITNLVSNTGVVASDTPGVGTARSALAAATYGNDKAIFGYGTGVPTVVSLTNLVSNTGVVASDTPGVGTARNFLAATSYGGDKAMFGFGRNPLQSPGSLMTSIINLVSNTGVVASNTPSVGTARSRLSAAGYGGDKAIFTFGDLPSFPGFYASPITNLVSNTGVIASDVSSTGTPRFATGAAGYSTSP